MANTLRQPFGLTVREKRRLFCVVCNSTRRERVASSMKLCRVRIYPVLIDSASHQVNDGIRQDLPIQCYFQCQRAFEHKIPFRVLRWGRQWDSWTSETIWIRIICTVIPGDSFGNLHPAHAQSTLGSTPFRDMLKKIWTGHPDLHPWWCLGPS